MIKKLNPKHLERLLNNLCNVKLYQEGLSEEGEPLTSLNLENQRCRFVEKTKIIITADGQKVELVGKVILLGDIAPNIKKISGGEVSNIITMINGKEVVNESKYKVYQASRPRNPDGSVHHTTLELM